ncbi:conserved protein [Tepidicaulis marinus]|jgi:hypothetical protein|uniref:Conserved protein n=1 Tax=Tepidicaulis marinus TaxID=1333998 RepID=A0A081BCY1_9HYPH|nr:hypothetical protein [Tepidicaulis marinus]GAK45899.1 conserved protein [Tepidicaulis marinus]
MNTPSSRNGPDFSEDFQGKAPEDGDVGHLPQTAADARWILLRDLFVFQGKLLLDGVRDLLLSPLSFIAAAIDLLSGPRSRNFYELLEMGRRSEHWINLFGAANPEPPAEGARSADDLADQIEALVKRQYEKGGITANAKSAIDKALDALQKKTRRDS